MTIAAAYLVSEGVVLGADSASSVFMPTPAGPGVLQVLHHAQKVFQVGEKSRFGVCSWGAGSIGNISHRSIIAQLADKIDDKATTVEQAANELCSLVKPLASVASKTMSDFFVGYNLGGWNPSSHEPECFRVEVNKSDGKVIKQQLGLCSFSGMPQFFARVFRGYDPRLMQNLINNLKALPEVSAIEGFDEKYEKAFEMASRPLAAEGFKDLPIREAIDFVYSYLHITVKATKFMFGAPLCGGPIEVGFISTDRRFRWVRHKLFSTAILEQEGGEFDEEK